MDSQTVRKAFRQLLKEFCDHLHMRRRRPQELHWCFHHLDHPFVPDYLLISEFGRNAFENFMNPFLAQNIDALWAKFVWGQFRPFISDQLDHQYVSQYDVEKHHQDLFLSEFSWLIHKYWKPFSVMTFTELFAFLARLLQYFSDLHDVDYDRYAELKKDQNALMLGLYREIREDVLAHPRRLAVASYLATRANWMDVFANDPNAFFLGFSDEVNQLLDDGELLDVQERDNPYFHTKVLEQLLGDSQKHVLLELDNSGEVVMDLLLAEVLQEIGHTVTVVAKSGPFLNDVTREEIMELLAELPYLNINVMDNGYDFAGKLLTSVSDEYKAAFEVADIKLLKGQGHFQTLPMGREFNGKFKPYLYKKPMFYMTGVRADLIQRCMKRLFGKKAPQAGSMFIYYYNAQNPSTYPA